MKHLKTGNFGEQHAADYLKQKGYTILESNWRFEKTEVDIIASINDLLVFVEVKTRNGKQFGLPEQSVSKAKEKQLSIAASEYIYQRNFTGEIRFDIISILLHHNCVQDILHLEDAFFPID